MSQIKNPMQIILKSHTGQQQPVIHRACSSQNSKPILINQQQQQPQPPNQASGHSPAPIGSSIKEVRADDKRQLGDAGQQKSSAQLLMSPSATIRPVIQMKSMTTTTTTPIATSSREATQVNLCAINASAASSTNKSSASTQLTRTAIISASPTSKQRSTAANQSSSSSSTIETTNTSSGSPPIGGPAGDSGNVAATARLLDMGKRLLDAAREGQTDQVRQLVESSGAPFTSDWLGTTALHLAAQHGHAEIADILLKGGVNRDARTKLERTALHLAAQSGSLQVVESLLIHGSDINARDMLKMTPLHWAVERRHIDIVERLIIGGADLNAKSKFQLTPLDIARNSNSHEIVDLFKVVSYDYLSTTPTPTPTITTATTTPTKQNWTNKDSIDLGLYDNKFYESHDILDVNYHQLMMAENAAAAAAAAANRTSMLDIDEPCIDLVELEWNSLKFETDFLRSGHNEASRGEQKPSCELDCLMKMVEELQKENEQLKRALEQISSPFAR